MENMWITIDIFLFLQSFRYMVYIHKPCLVKIFSLIHVFVKAMKTFGSNRSQSNIDYRRRGHRSTILLRSYDPDKPATPFHLIANLSSKRFSDTRDLVNLNVNPQ